MSASRPAPHEWNTDRGTLRIWAPRRGLVMIQFSGHLTADLALHLRNTVNHALAEQTPLDVFNDWWDMKSYDSQPRIDLTQWALRIRSGLGAVHILTRSKLVGMGVAVANVPLKGLLHAHSDRRTWEADLRTAGGSPMPPP